MGAELRPDDMEVAEGSFNDSRLFQFVGEVLQAVRMDPFLVDPRYKEQYDFIVDTVDSTKKRSLDDENLLVPTLEALSEAVSKIDIVYHHALLHNIFTMSIWYLRGDTRLAASSADLLGFLLGVGGSMKFTKPEFDILKTIFRTSVLRVHKSKFAQFIMFYACSLSPEICGLGFAIFLMDIFANKEEDPISRTSAVSYVGSYLSRARFISADIVVSILKRLVNWCVAYCDHQIDRGTETKPVNHQIFYACCQAVMYVLCFRLRSIMDYPIIKSDLFQMEFGYIFTHKLQPLKVCLPSIVNEFLRQAKAARLFNSSSDSVFEDPVGSDLSKALGGINRLDMFFPFDPYLLKESDRYMGPNFEFWSMVKTTYSDKSDNDEELGNLDAPEMNVGSLDDHVEIDFNSDDDLEYSINKMSITPRRSFYHPMTMNHATGLSMPAKIRPSMSPPS